MSTIIFPKAFKIAIVGGGPGGLSLAHTLLRCGLPAANIRVYERASMYAPNIGGGFGCAFNGLTVFRALGLSDTNGENTTNSFSIERTTLPIKNWVINELEKANTESMAILRDIPQLTMPDGSGALQGALRAEVLIGMMKTLPTEIVELNREITNIQVGGEGKAARIFVHHTDTNTTVEEEVDVIVAADGIRSKIRELTFGPSKPTYSGAEIYYGVASPGHPLVYHHEWSAPPLPSPSPSSSVPEQSSTITENLRNDKGWCVQFPGRGKYFISAGTRIVHTKEAFPELQVSIQQDRLQGKITPLNTVYYGFVRHVPEHDHSTKRDEEQWESQQVSIGGPQSVGPLLRSNHDPMKNGDVHKDTVWKEVGNGQYGSFVRDMIDATPSGRLLKFKMYYREGFQPWYKGRVVLLGDAAHAPLPNIGQGLNMALEDGFCLGTELAAAFVNHSASFTNIPTGFTMDKILSTAFHNYQQPRYKKTNKMVQLSKTLLYTESGIMNPFFSRLRTKLMSKVFNQTVDQLRAQIGQMPVVNEHSTKYLLK